MDRCQAQLAGPGVGEAMGDVRGSDHDRSATNNHSVVAELEAGLARLDDEYFWIGVLVQPRAGTRRRVHEDDRERNVSVVCTDELVRVLGVRKVVELHDRGHLVTPPGMKNSMTRVRLRRVGRHPPRRHRTAVIEEVHQCFVHDTQTGKRTFEVLGTVRYQV
jgi:hypothetical protein